MVEPIRPIEGCKCLNRIAKDRIIKGLDLLSKNAIEEIKRIQKGPFEDTVADFQKMKSLLNYINVLDKIKQSTQNTQACTHILIKKQKRLIGDCSCLNPITRSFILGSFEEIINREPENIIRDQLTAIRRDTISIPECK